MEWPSKGGENKKKFEKGNGLKQLRERSVINEVRKLKRKKPESKVHGKVQKEWKSGKSEKRRMKVDEKVKYESREKNRTIK